MSGAHPSETGCRNCGGEQWVCENHQDAAWNNTLVHGCECGAGAPCPVCNREMACASFVPHWWAINDAAKSGADVLICGGTVSYDAETFPTDRPFDGVTIARYVRGSFCGGYGSEYDGEYWHEPKWWMPVPKPAQPPSEQTP
jgi:hypothetical protein